MEMKITKISTLPQLDRKKRVAAYARVSTGKDAMLHSLSAQVSYYNNLIQNNNEWEFAGIYADEAMSGTKDNREEFNRMVDDCKAGKIDLIITKAISRFARNTATLLSTIRELSSVGVDVFFEEQNLHSISCDGEMILTLLASCAQEEARSASENVKWRVKKDFKQGILNGGNDCYGYKLIDKKFVLVPEEAEIVKMIFAWYICGEGVVAISKKLDDMGIKPVRAKYWLPNTIMRMLKDRCYVGDLILQKTYVTDYVSKKKKRNHGEFDKYFVENDHEPIIDIETFKKANALMVERAKRFKAQDRTALRYPLSGKIVCGECGSRFGHKVYMHSSPGWICSAFDRKGKKACQSRKVPEYAMDEAVDAVIGGYDNIKVLDFIEVFNNNRLLFHLKNKEIKEFIWEERSRSQSWTDEMREEAKKRTIINNKNKKRGANGKWQKSE